jgi:hypothetical protein
LKAVIKIIPTYSKNQKTECAILLTNNLLVCFIYLDFYFYKKETHDL